MSANPEPGIVKTAIVTGAAGGLGLRMSELLSATGHRVIMADVDIEGCRVEAERLSDDGGETEALFLDLADLRSVEEFASRFESKEPVLHLLVNNAGVMCPPMGRTAQGYELQWGVNHLGHFALTGHLLSTLARTPDSRVVTQTSIVHDTADINLDNLDSRVDHDPWKAYKQSKLAVLLFSLELQRRLDHHLLDHPLSLACHPGLVDTGLYRNSRLMRLFLKPFMHGLDAGAAPAMVAATCQDIRGGDLIGPDGWRGFKGAPNKCEPLGRGGDLTLASKVWNISKKMTGIDMDSILEDISVMTSDHIR